MKIYVRSVWASARKFKEEYVEFCDKFCDNEPCEYVEHTAETDFKDGQTIRVFDDVKYAERLAKGKEVYRRVFERGKNDKTEYVHWWEGGERYYIDIDEL
jgi:hypothetical protein